MIGFNPHGRDFKAKPTFEKYQPRNVIGGKVGHHYAFNLPTSRSLHQGIAVLMAPNHLPIMEPSGAKANLTPQNDMKQRQVAQRTAEEKLAHDHRFPAHSASNPASAPPPSNTTAMSSATSFLAYSNIKSKIPNTASIGPSYIMCIDFRIMK